jgi:hypothetical protein
MLKLVLQDVDQQSLGSCPVDGSGSRLEKRSGGGVDGDIEMPSTPSNGDDRGVSRTSGGGGVSRGGGGGGCIGCCCCLSFIVVLGSYAASVIQIINGNDGFIFMPFGVTVVFSLIWCMGLDRFLNTSNFYHRVLVPLASSKTPTSYSRLGLVNSL